ncbi:MAG: hypothetical protein B7Y25_06435 [Alphaproteobacteria bacterium 16-39-46]|nr:MAG: hypothetical protein B7Y25_06435 [Alphaproteobacteria bacterium 16-39-46]OZA42313.1 MAG: hypothetical protein B7X84_06505 [Alphaproteobacteria bacterium 17-39-52]HQS84530.1 hypothetical protein [Alphaproteobacteria bacterium]HQS94323.1 hypothetical protein [Alphaproteobacteria bacterium]
MNIKPIHTEHDYEKALIRAESLMEALYGSPEGDELEIISTLIADYEEKKFPIKAPDPIEAIKFRITSVRRKE